MAEERWLAGAGPQPGTPAQRLPERAPLMLPRAGIGRWRLAGRTARAWVADDASLRARDTAGADRVLVPAGQARAGWWLVDRGPVGARLPPADGGWLVIGGPAGPLTALRLAEWLPGWPAGPADPAGAAGPVPGPRLVRAAGAEAVCRALGVTLESLADPDEAARLVGAVPPAARFELAPRPDRSPALVIAGEAGAVVSSFFLLLAHAKLAAVVVLAVGVGVPPVCELAAWLRRRRLTGALPGQLSAWWAASPADGPVRGRGIGSRAGPGGPELALADGHGGEAWLAGPGAGGAAGLAALSGEPGSDPWALLVYDRSEHLLAGLRGPDWAGGPGAAARLQAGASALGLAVPEVTAPAQAMAAARDRDRAAVDPADEWLSLGVLNFTLVLLVPLPVAAGFLGHWPVGGALLAWLLVLVAARVAAARRAVL